VTIVITVKAGEHAKPSLNMAALTPRCALRLASAAYGQQELLRAHLRTDYQRHQTKISLDHQRETAHQRT